MPVRVADVEVPLTPWRVGRFGIGLESGCDEAPVDVVGVVDVEHGPAPERDRTLVHEQVDEVVAELERGEVRSGSAEAHPKIEYIGVEAQRPGHVGDAEGEGVDLHRS